MDKKQELVERLNLIWRARQEVWGQYDDKLDEMEEQTLKELEVLTHNEE